MKIGQGTSGGPSMKQEAGVYPVLNIFKQRHVRPPNRDLIRRIPIFPNGLGRSLLKNSRTSTDFS